MQATTVDEQNSLWGHNRNNDDGIGDGTYCSLLVPRLFLVPKGVKSRNDCCRADTKKQMNTKYIWESQGKCAKCYWHNKSMPFPSDVTFIIITFIWPSSSWPSYDLHQHDLHHYQFFQSFGVILHHEPSPLLLAPDKLLPFISVLDKPSEAITSSTHFCHLTFHSSLSFFLLSIDCYGHA